MRLIDADELHIDFDKYVEHIRLMKKGRMPKTEIAILLDCKGAIDNAPTVDAVPVRHGKWLDPETLKRPWFRHHIFECSVCRNILDMDGVNAGRGDANYCPNCGARMDEEE